MERGWKHTTFRVSGPLGGCRPLLLLLLVSTKDVSKEIKLGRDQLKSDEANKYFEVSAHLNSKILECKSEAV